MPTFRSIFLLCAATLICGCTGTPPGSANQRPNVLFLFADDLRPDAVGAFGNPNIDTPSIDALVQRGFRFARNYCMGSRHGAVCAPSRAMLMTGRTLHRVVDSMEGAPTMGEVFGAQGYVTFGTGKWHNGRPSFARTFQQGRAIMFGGMSDHFAVPVVDMDPDTREFSRVRSGSKHSSEVFADSAISFLRSRARKRNPEPFFCYLAFTAPHDPRDAPAEFLRRKRADPPPLPVNFRPQHGWMIDRGTLTLRDEKLAAWPRDPSVVRDQLAEYYALIEHLDVQIGRILAALEATGLAKETIVVFTADHGLAIGSHGLLGKQNLYEHSMGCPLVLAGPGIPRGRSTALTYLLDLFPTLAGLCGVELPAGIEGVDLMPVLRGDSGALRESLFTLYRDNQRAVRDRRYKLIRFTKTNKTFLFDLRDDPHELNDLSDDPEFEDVQSRLWSMLETWQERTGDKQALSTEDPLPQRIDLSGHPRQPDRWQPKWIRNKYFGDADENRR